MPINSTHPTYDCFIDQWQRCRDAVNGSDAIKGGGEVYLPKLSAHYDPVHGQRAYESYKKRALWFGATERTLSGYVGAIMRRDPAFDVPALIKNRLDDITDGGQTAIQFTHTLIKELLATGRLGMLVDKSVEGGAEGEPAFIKLYYPENILNWITDINGALLVVTLLEVVYVADPSDPYVLKCTHQIRELALSPIGYVQRVYRKKMNADGCELEEYELYDNLSAAPTIRGVPLTEIPFFFVSCDQDSMSVSKPPMLDLVDANISHYQLDADYRHGLHFTALPTPVITGVSDAKDYYLGSEVVINLQNENSKAFFLEFQGTGLTAIKDAMEERKLQMAALGASYIQRGKQGKGIETAEAARIQQSGETSLLTTIIGRVEEGLETALEFIAKWEGDDSAEVEVTLNRDLIDATLTAAEITAMVGAWQAGTMPTDELYWNWQKGGILNPTTTAEVFKSAVGDAPKPATATGAAVIPGQGAVADGSMPGGVAGGGTKAPGAAPGGTNKE